MPTYEYLCSSCHHEWEFEQSIKDDPITECPSCHEATAKRQISRGGGFILKGSGWYADLYSSSSNKAAPSEKKDEGTTKKDEGSKPGGTSGSSEGSGGSGTSSGGTSSGSSGSTPAASGSSTKSSPSPA
jgi:putative FmdB family regulatory protein